MGYTSRASPLGRALIFPPGRGHGLSALKVWEKVALFHKAVARDAVRVQHRGEVQASSSSGLNTVPPSPVPLTFSSWVHALP